MKIYLAGPEVFLPDAAAIGLSARSHRPITYSARTASTDPKIASQRARSAGRATSIAISDGDSRAAPFGEGLDDNVWSAAMNAAYECDVLLVVGTSAVVYPAASLIPIAKRHKEIPAKVIEVNLARTEASTSADVWLYGPSGVILPKLMAKFA